MLINNIDIASFKAQLLKKNIQTAEVVVFNDWLRNALNPLYLGKQEKHKQLKIRLMIKDSDDEICLNDIGNLIKQFEKCTIKFDDLSFYYDCLIVNKAHERIRKGWYTLDVELKAAYAYKPAITETLDHVASKAITVLGNLPTPAVVTITPSIDTISAVLTGLSKTPITISNLHANIPVIIDGEKCVVTESDIDANLTTVTGATKWNFRKYNIANFANPDSPLINVAPTYDSIPTGASYSQQLIADGTNLLMNIGYDYLGYLKTGVYVTSAKTVNFTFYHDDGCGIYLNGVLVYTRAGPKYSLNGAAAVTLNLVAGWNIIEIIWIQHYGPDGIWNIIPTITSLVEQLNCFYSKSAGTPGVVNKFADADMWAFPTLQPEAVTVGISITTATVQIAYKPKFM